MDERVFEEVAPAVERLRLAIEARVHAEIAEAEAIADLAAEHSWSTHDEYDVIGQRPVRLGADGTALVGEFLPLEIAALKGISVGAATWLIRDILNLQHRHPHLWAAVLRGAVPVYRAAQLTTLAAGFELTGEQALAVDAEVAPKLGHLGWRRILELTRAAITRHAPEAVLATSTAARSERFARVHQSDDPTLAYLSARLDTVDAATLDHTLNQVADALATNGDDDSREVRRAKALGILASPERATELLSTGTDNQRGLPRAVVHLHLSGGDLNGEDGVARAERLGPLHVQQLRHLLGHSRVTLGRIVRGDADAGVATYEIPERMRDVVVARDRYEIFPFSSRPARSQDLDHTDEYRPDAHGTLQTRPGNLGPLSRKAHRAKTFGTWHLNQPRPGIFWWHSPGGITYRVDPDGTTQLTGHYSLVEYHLRRLIDEYRAPP